MWLIRCNVRIRTIWPSGSGVRVRPGHHLRNRESDHTGCGFQADTDDVGNVTGGDEACSSVHRTRERHAEGVQSPSSDNRFTEADHGSTGPTVSTSAVCPLRDWSQDSGTRNCSRRSQDRMTGSRMQRTTPGGSGGNEQGRTTTWRGSPPFEHAVSQCSSIGSPGSSHGPSDSRRQRPETSRLPGLFRVGSNSIERLDCLTPDGDMTQTHQLSRWTVNDAVRIQPPEGPILRPDQPTRPAGWNDSAGDLLAFIQLLEAAFGDPEQVVTAERKMREIEQT